MPAQEADVRELLNEFLISIDSLLFKLARQHMRGHCRDDIENAVCECRRHLCLKALPRFDSAKRNSPVSFAAQCAGNFLCTWGRNLRRSARYRKSVPLEYASNKQSPNTDRVFERALAMLQAEPERWFSGDLLLWARARLQNPLAGKVALAKQLRIYQLKAMALEAEFMATVQSLDLEDLVAGQSKKCLRMLDRRNAEQRELAFDILFATCLNELINDATASCTLGQLHAIVGGVLSETFKPLPTEPK